MTFCHLQSNKGHTVCVGVCVCVGVWVCVGVCGWVWVGVCVGVCVQAPAPARFTSGCPNISRQHYFRLPSQTPREGDPALTYRVHYIDPREHLKK